MQRKNAEIGLGLTYQKPLQAALGKNPEKKWHK